MWPGRKQDSFLFIVMSSLARDPNCSTTCLPYKDVSGSYPAVTSCMSMLRASCLTLEINRFRCYEVKIEESEKVGSRQESNPEHLWLEVPVLCHWATIAGQQSSICTAQVRLNASVAAHLAVRGWRKIIVSMATRMCYLPLILCFQNRWGHCPLDQC